MDTTRELLDKIDDALENEGDQSENSLCDIPSTKEVISSIENVIPTTRDNVKDGRGNFDESQKQISASDSQSKSNFSMIELPYTEMPSLRKDSIEEIKNLSESETNPDTFQITETEKKEDESLTVKLDTCCKQLTTESVGISNPVIDAKEHMTQGDCETTEEQQSEIHDSFNTAEVMKASVNETRDPEKEAVVRADEEEQPPRKRLKTTNLNYEELDQQCADSIGNVSSESLMYTATHIAQDDLQLEEEGNNSILQSNESIPLSSPYTFQGPPRQLTGAWGCYISETCNNYLRGCKWAPDGTCLMTNSNDNCIRVFNLPEQLYSMDQEPATFEEMVPVLKMKEADSIYDFCWFSKMSSADPDSSCLAVSSKDTPIHMYDAYTGDLRCSYRAYNNVDQLVAAYCLSFDQFGEKLYGGFNKMIRVFDVSRPGRDFVNRPTYAKEGQSGIISCIAHSPTEIGLYAAGSYSRSIALYKEPTGEMICMFDGQQGGVTHIMFSPDGSKLYSGGRKDNEILCWDLRNPGQILYTLERKVSTNQRMYFDMTKDGKFVVSGCHDGHVRVWDTLQPPVQSENCQEPIIEPIMSFQGHFDTLNGISLHPTLPVVATTSGQRHFPSFIDSSDDDTDTEEQESTIDNSLRLWWIS